MKRFTQKEYNDYENVKHNEFMLNQVLQYNCLLMDKSYTETLLCEDCPDDLWTFYNDITEKINNLNCDSIDKHWNEYFSLLNKLE